MYRISVMILHKGHGTTLIPEFYLNMGENGVNSSYDATRKALDVIDPMGSIQGNPDMSIEIRVY